MVRCECKKLKVEKYRHLRQYRRSQSTEDLEQYKCSRNAFKYLCDKKERQFQSNQLQCLVEATACPKSFWKKVKHLSNSKRRTSNNIHNDEWKRHFEQLFQYDDNDSMNDDEELDYIHEIDLDEVQDTIFNSQITEEEVLKSVQALHESKAAGLDEISPGFFIHCIDLILPLVVRFLTDCLSLVSFRNHEDYHALYRSRKKEIRIVSKITGAYHF